MTILKFKFCDKFQIRIVDIVKLIKQLLINNAFKPNKKYKFISKHTKISINN